MASAALEFNQKKGISNIEVFFIKQQENSEGNL